MASRAESQDEMADCSQDDGFALSTVEEGSEGESQVFTLDPTMDDEQRDDGGDDATALDGRESSHMEDETAADEDAEHDARQYYNQLADDDERASAEECLQQDDVRYGQHEDDDEAAQQTEEPREPLEEIDEDASSYVVQCHMGLESLRKRKREQEERVESLVEETFAQIDTLINSLMGTIQECHAASHNRFEIADAKLAQNLQFHHRMEKKLRMIASILSDESASAQGEE